MDLRKRLHVHPNHEIPIHLSEEFDEEEDKEGNPTGEKTYHGVDTISFKDLLDKIKQAGISESDYDKVECVAGYHPKYYDSIMLSITYNKPKTQKEIDDEMDKLIADRKLFEKAKEQKRLDKENKKLEKQKAIDSLTPEQKKALRIK